MLTVLMTTIQFNLFVMIRAVRKSRIHDHHDYRYFHRVPWFLAIAVISCHGREYSRDTYYMQYQFLKGRYCLSFAVLFHFGRAVNAPQRQTFSDTTLTLQVMVAFNARD